MSRLLLVPIALIASVSFGQIANPVIRVVNPATPVVETSGPSVVLTGVASAGVAQVYWVSQTGNRGDATLGNSSLDGGQNPVSWSTDAIFLRSGPNQITVVAVDAQNHSSATTVAVVASNRSLSSLTLRPDIRTGVWRGQIVTYEVVDGLAITAGDMVLGTAEEVAAAGNIGNKTPKAGPVRHTNAIDYTSLLWPRVGGVVQVPFTIQAGSASAAVANAVASFNGSLSGFVQYVARGAEANFVTFNLSAADTSGACASNVGMIGGQQFITGSGSCAVPTLVHEMGHSIGLYHEHQRTDNATFITATLANSDKPLIAGNFDAIINNQQNIGLYDFASIMHYGAFSFSKAGLPVLESIPAGIPLSNATGFSLGDIDGIRRLYSFAPTQVTVTTNPQGLGIIVDGVTLTAPQTFAWTIGSSHTLDLPADPQVTSPADGSTYKYGRWNDSVSRFHSITVDAGAGFLTSPASSPAVTLYEANFIRLQPFGTAVFPGGSGTVTPSPAPQSIFGGSFYTDRQLISLTGTPTGANHFAGWFNIPFPQSDNPKSYFIQSPTPSATGGFVSAAVTLFGANISGPNTTNPGISGTVDGNFVLLPQAFANDVNFGGATWAGGTSHALVVTTPQSPVTTNVRYLFGSWTDAAPANPSRNINAPASGVQAFTAVLNPVYRTFPLLSPNCGGNVNFSPLSPTGDGFYADGSLLSVTAAPNPGISFGGWFGDLSGNTNPSNVTIHDQFIPGAFFNSTSTPISVTGFSPAKTTVSAGAMDLIVNGTGFTASTQAFWNLSFRSSTFNSSTQIAVHLVAGDLATAGGNRVSIQNVVNACNLFVEGTFDVQSATTVLGITKTHNGNFNVGQQNANYNITLNNAGTVTTTGALTVTDTLPTGLTFVSATGGNWTCGAPVGQVVTCTYNSTITPGNSTFPLVITVNVNNNAPVGTNSITNSATASGGGASNSPTASDPTTVLGPAVLSITKTHTGNFNVGQQNATYNIMVSNGAAAGPTVGTFTVTDTLPTGLTFASSNGGNWTCGAPVGQVVTCTYGGTLTPGASTFGLSLLVNVNNNAPVGTNSITNSATASGGGASNSPTASDPTTVLGPAVLSITKTHTGNFNVGQQNATYNIMVSNSAAAGPTVGTFTVTDTLPTGLTFASSSGGNWTCGAPIGQVVTCTYNSTLAPGASTFGLSLLVNVNNNAPVGTNSITNSATASGGGASNSPTASDPTTVLGPAVLSITKTHTGNFNVGQQNATYNIMVSNSAAAGPTVGTFTVTDTLPTGLTFASSSGGNWTCGAPIGQVVTCTYNSTLAPGASTFGLSLLVNVNNNAPVGTNSITNSATASGGGASNSPTASDPTTVLGPAVLSITKTHTGNFNVGQQNATYNIMVSNSAAAGPTVGTFTVTDTLPTGLTFASSSGGNWTCGAPIGQVVTCTYNSTLAPGASTFGLSLLVNVNNNAPVGTNSITNSATASGGGASNSPTASDPTTVLGPAVLSITKTHTGNFNVGQQNATYNIMVSNGAAAGPTVGAFTVTDTLPTGLTFVSGTGGNWTCGAPVGQVVTCTYNANAVLTPGASTFGLAITVNVNNNAPVGTNSITNSATASGGGASNSPTANDPTTVAGPAVLSITKTHTGNFNVGQQNAIYSITVSDSATAGPTVGNLTVTDTLPTGLTFASGSGGNWTCGAPVGQVVTCTYGATINPGASTFGLSLLVNVNNNAPVGTNSITNSATASGGGASNSPTASDPTTIVPGPPVAMNLNAGTTPQSTAINTAFPNALAVTLLDIGNNPVPGINVTFTAPGAGASGKFSNNTATITVVTNASGIASAALTANGTAGGPYTVTAASGALTTVNFSLTNIAAGPASVTANAGTTPQSATINTAFANALAVTVKDASNVPLSGINVTFTAPGSGMSGVFSNSTATITVATNVSGVAAAPFTANASAGGPYTVTAATGALSTTFSLTNTAGAATQMSANAGTTPQSATINTAFANALAVTVKDIGNNPVAGINVTFTSPGAGASGLFANSTTTITVATNAAGVAAAPFTANSTAGVPYTVTAAAAGLATVNFSLTNLVGAATQMTANAGTTPQSATVTTAFVNALAVTVKDIGNNPVPGVNVTFTAPGASASGLFSNSTATITVATNGAGVAAAPFTANTTPGGPYTVTAAASGLTTVNFSLTNTAGSANSMTANAGSTPQSATVNTAFANALSVTVKDVGNNPLAGINVTFTSPGAGASGLFANSTTTITVATNASGVASAPFTANATAGAPYTVTAASAGLTTVNFSLTNLAGPATQMTANAGTTPQSATINTAFANALAVTVKDALNNPVPGINVTFTAPGSGASGLFSNSTTTITVATNASGVAAASFTANSAAGGPHNITAAATGLVTVNFALTNLTGPPASMTANAGTTPQSATVLSAFGNPLAVTVRDAGNNPVPGINVTFTSPGAGASGVFSNSTTVITVVTNASGVAAAPFTANATSGGPYTVTAMVSGVTTVNFSLTNSTAPLQSIAVTPANPSISKGLTQQFTATGTFSDNSTQNLTGSVTWASATPGTATITAGGLATGAGIGTSSISATLSGITGSTVLTVTAAVLQSIAVTPANPSIPKGVTQQFAATGTFSDNSTQNLTGSVTWASATPGTATITAGGLATGAGIGTSTISATLSGITGSTVLTVTAAVLQSIAVTPPNPSISKGLTQQFTATGTFSDNSTQNLTGTVTWASATPGTATITAGGLATGAGIGTSTISATLSGITGSTVLTVSAAVLQSIAVTPANPSIPKGLLQQFMATGTFSDNSTQNLTGTVTWASATPGTATITAGGLATGAGIGTSTISATLSGITGSTVLTVTAAVLQAIAVTPPNPSIAQGTTQQFTATGTFSDNSTPNLTALVIWASATTSVATINAAGLASGVGTGTSTISATLGGVIGSTVLSVTAAANPPTVVSFNVLFGTQTYNVIGTLRHRLPWQISGIQVVFSKPIAAADVNSLTGFTTTGLSGLGTTTLTWTISPVAQGAVSVALLGAGPDAIKDAGGVSLASGAGFNQNLKILWADFSDDGIVNASDLVLVNNARSAAYNIFADMNGDGLVDINDVQIVRTRNGTTLP